jgi:hypothetical protein
MQTTQNDQTSESNSNPLDILQQFDGLLKNHSIVVTDRDNLAKLFERIVDLCTQMPKTKLKAALKAATQAPKTKATPKTKAQPKTKTTNSKEIMVGPDGAADAPTIADLGEVTRGRGRPRKAATEIVTENPNPETAEKKRRGRPKKDKSVTISSNDDEDALIEKMMADVASMQKDEDHIPYPADVAAVAAVADVAAVAVAVDEVEVEVEVPVTVTVATAVMSDDDTDTDESLSPIIQNTFEFHQEGEVDVEKDVVITLPTKPVKEVKAKPVKEVKVKPVKEVKVKPVKEVKAKANPVKEVKAKANPVKEVNANPVKALASFSAPAPPPVAIVASSQRLVENQEMNGGIYLTDGFPRTSFSYNGKTYLRTETDNVYDTLTLEMVGVWDHANHEVIYAFDEEDDGMYFSDEE